LVIKMKLLNKESIEKINFFERIAHVKVRDLIEKEDKLIFILQEHELIKIIRNKGKNIKNAESLMHKKIKIIEFNKDPLKFVKNFIYPIKALNIELNSNIIEIKVEDRKSKGLLIGRESKNLDELNSLMRSYYNLAVKVI